MLTIKKIKSNKKEFLELLLLADPEEKMIDLYLNEGEMYVLMDGENIIGEAVVVKLSDIECEIKNIAIEDKYEGRGYGKRLLEYLFNIYKDEYQIMFVGTTKKIIPFYNKLGFVYSHTIRNFFTDNYTEPIFEDDSQCIDMIYLKKNM